MREKVGSSQGREKVERGREGEKLQWMRWTEILGKEKGRGVQECGKSFEYSTWGR